MILRKPFMLAQSFPSFNNCNSFSITWRGVGLTSLYLSRITIHRQTQNRFEIKRPKIIATSIIILIYSPLAGGVASPQFWAFFNTSQNASYRAHYSSLPDIKYSLVSLLKYNVVLTEQSDAGQGYLHFLPASLSMNSQK